MKKTKQEWMVQGAGGSLALAETDGGLQACLRPESGGTEWRSPLLEVEIIDRMQERVERVAKLTIMHLAEEENALHVVLRDACRGVTFGLWLEWRDGELAVLLPPAEVEEANDTLYRLHSVTVLPGLMATPAAGELLLPVATGWLCRPAGKPKCRDRFLIYGEQERWELVPTLPVAAVRTPQGGIVCLARQGACDAWCEIETDGDGGARLAMGAMLRRHWIDPVDWTEREFRYQFLAPGEDAVLAAARRVRRHVAEEFAQPTLAARAAESPACAYQQRAYTMKLFHGIQRQGIMMYGRENRPDELLFQRVMTFAQAEAGLRKLRAAGLERVCLQSVGWNPKGHDGAWPTDFPIDRRLGGEAGLRSLIGAAKQLDYRITTHLNLGMSCFKSPHFNPDWVIHDLWREPKVTGEWGGGVHANHWGLALPPAMVEGRLEAMRRLGFDSMQYLDFQGNPLYVNYHPRHGGPRSDYAAGIRRYQQAARDIFGAVQIEMGFLYCATHADAVCAPYYHPFKAWGLPSEWPICALLDQQVPVWQLALHDRVAQEQQGLDWKCAMNAVLFGKVMRDEWSADAGVMPVLDDRRIAQLKAVYDLVTVRFAHLVPQELVHWQKLADQVEATRFADGTEVVADFNAGRLIVNGQEIPCPPALATA